MQLNKSSKKTKKIAVEATAASPETTQTADLKPKARASKSSQPKKSEPVETVSLTHHHKVAAPVAETIVIPNRRHANREEIAKLAYSYWVARGNMHGSPEEDWLRAERALTAMAAHA